MQSPLSNDELFVLSFYRASELAGGLLFGKIAFHTDFDELRAPLTRHAAEEVVHGWLWTKAIQELGHVPLKVTQTYQSEYGREFGMPTRLVDILCLTQVLERRVIKHYSFHLAQNPHPVIEKTLHKMMQDEAEHLSWVSMKLDGYANSGHAPEVEELMDRLTKADGVVYERLCQEPHFAHFFGE